MLRVSIYYGIQWAVFEPNDEPLWSQLRLNIGSFMTTLFRQGAFQGATPSQAFFVKCDSETTTQADIDLGVVNILVGFRAAEAGRVRRRQDQPEGGTGVRLMTAPAGKENRRMAKFTVNSTRFDPYLGFNSRSSGTASTSPA